METEPSGIPLLPPAVSDLDPNQETAEPQPLILESLISTQGIAMSEYIEPVDAQILRKIAINVAVLIGVSFFLIGVVAAIT